MTVREEKVVRAMYLTLSQVRADLEGRMRAVVSVYADLTRTDVDAALETLEEEARAFARETREEEESGP